MILLGHYQIGFYCFSYIHEFPDLNMDVLSNKKTFGPCLMQKHKDYMTYDSRSQRSCHASDLPSFCCSRSGEANTNVQETENLLLSELIKLSGSLSQVTFQSQAFQIPWEGDCQFEFPSFLHHFNISHPISPCQSVVGA